MPDLNEPNAQIQHRLPNRGLVLSHDPAGGIYAGHPVPPLAWGDATQAGVGPATLLDVEEAARQAHPGALPDRGFDPAALRVGDLAQVCVLVPADRALWDRRVRDAPSDYAGEMLWARVRAGDRHGYAGELLHRPAILGPEVATAGALVYFLPRHVCAVFSAVAPPRGDSKGADPGRGDIYGPVGPTLREDDTVATKGRKPIPIVPSSKIYLSRRGHGDEPRFARLFQSTWRRVPLGARRRMTRHWKSVTAPRRPRDDVEPAISPRVELVLGWDDRQEAEYGSPWLVALTGLDGHRLQFHAGAVGQMSDGVVEDLVAHELAHVWQRAAGRAFASPEDEEADADDLMRGWGFDPFSIDRWAGDVGIEDPADRIEDALVPGSDYYAGRCRRHPVG